MPVYGILGATLVNLTSGAIREMGGIEEDEEADLLVKTAALARDMSSHKRELQSVSQRTTSESSTQSVLQLIHSGTCTKLGSKV